MNVAHTFESLRGTELQRDDFHENMSFEAYMEEYQKRIGTDDKLKELMRIKETEDMVDSINLETILTINFMAAKEVIDQMTIAKRIAMLEDLSKYRIQLYDSFSRYGEKGVPRDEQLSAEDFRMLLGRVKHLEIIQNWLYGIV